MAVDDHGLPKFLGVPGFSEVEVRSLTERSGTRIDLQATPPHTGAMASQEDHRRIDRHQVRFQLVYDDGVSFNAAAVSDVSEHGLFLETPLTLAPGTQLKLTPLTGGALFDIDAQVCRVVQEGEEVVSGMGVAFVGLTPDERRSLVALIQKLETRPSSVGPQDVFLGARAA